MIGIATNVSAKGKCSEWVTLETPTLTDQVVFFEDLILIIEIGSFILFYQRFTDKDLIEQIP